MDGTAVKELRDGFAQPRVEVVEYRSRALLPPGWKMETPPLAGVSPVDMGTLSGLRDYLASNVDELHLDEVMLHVVSHDVVHLVARIENEAAMFRRNLLARSRAGACPAILNEYMDAEEFVVQMQTAYVPTKERDEFALLVRSIKENNARQTDDDGFGQEVTVQRGVTFVGREKIPNPVMLVPYRTFREVIQPASPFVVRVKKGDESPEVALFEADGGTWRIQATKNVADWLRKEVPGVAVIA